MAKSKKLIKQKKKYQILQECHEEMGDYLNNLMEQHNRTEEELRYLHDFIHYKKPEEEFRCFREHAHEDENSELPFPHLVL